MKTDLFILVQSVCLHLYGPSCDLTHPSTIQPHPNSSSLSNLMSNGFFTNDTERVQFKLRL